MIFFWGGQHLFFQVFLDGGEEDKNASLTCFSSPGPAVWLAGSGNSSGI